jgi:hypothetical protein
VRGGAVVAVLGGAHSPWGGGTALEAAAVGGLAAPGSAGARSGGCDRSAVPADRRRRRLDPVEPRPGNPRRRRQPARCKRASVAGLEIVHRQRGSRRLFQAHGLPRGASHRRLHLRGPDLTRLSARSPAAHRSPYARVGATQQHFEISGARSIVETYEGQPNGYEVAQRFIRAGYRGCWVLALGTNDAADVYVGSNVGRAARIQRMMSLIGDQPVMWVNVKSLLSSGPYAEQNMRLWDQALLQACPRYPNMRVFDWASMAKSAWFIEDGIHYNSHGYAARSRLIAQALAHAFPASGARSGCLVR